MSVILKVPIVLYYLSLSVLISVTSVFLVFLEKNLLVRIFVKKFKSNQTTEIISRLGEQIFDAKKMKLSKMASILCRPQSYEEIQA